MRQQQSGWTASTVDVDRQPVCGAGSHRSISGARARAQQQTGRVAIDRRDRQTDRRVYERTRDCLMRLPHSLLCGSRNRSCASWLAVAVWSRNTWITFAHNRLERRLITWQWNRIAHSINISPSLTLASAFLKPFFSVTDIFVFFLFI